MWENNQFLKKLILYYKKREMNFQVYTSTCGPKAESHVVPDNQLWDNQRLVFESNSMEKISEHFGYKFVYPWQRNTLYYPRHENGQYNLENGGLEIHSKSNNNMKIKPPIFKPDGEIFFKSVPRGGGTYRKRREAMIDRVWDYDGKLLPISNYEDY